jgi:hypothetical protein
MAHPGGFHSSYLIPGLVRNGFLTRFWAFRRTFTSRHLLPRKSGDSVFELPLSKPGRNLGLLRHEVIRWQLPPYHFAEPVKYLGSIMPARGSVLYHTKPSRTTTPLYLIHCLILATPLRMPYPSCPGSRVEKRQLQVQPSPHPHPRTTGSSISEPGCCGLLRHT